MKTFFNVDDLEISDKSFFLIAGPCVIEEEGLTREIASEAKKITSELGIPFIFKASFDKANRSSIRSPRGPGIEKGLPVLERIRADLQLPVLSDIHEPWQAEAAARVLSIIQIPAFLSRQTDLLQAAARTGLPLNIKKSQMMSPADIILAVNKAAEAGGHRVMLTERGTFFGYNNLVVDFRSIPRMKESGCPVVMDATHAVQRPSGAGEISGGDPQFIPMLAAAGIVAGADGVFLEIHPRPEKALSDGTNSLPLKELRPLLIRLQKLYNVR
ncbi:3-deoxy-8-phosphooctulonate synthase [candidate division KSB1 bacterium]|nr:3-deoxy-8-phosphooctulonate synthase [Candidatus Aminicenantes bacterium]RQW03560.1 MAG: 3-deoxy-8-phosphooctulonate synthase [candidate division KSB1 bacterium]